MNKKIKLFQHQKDAITSWKKAGCRGLLEMATGTGKTFAALGCLNGLQKENPRIHAIISCPYKHLVQQWKREINKFGIEYDDLIIADSTNVFWKDDLADRLMDICLGYKNMIITITTHRSLSSINFIKIIRENANGYCNILIADEVHGLGAELSKEGLLDEYKMRLGLSATPRRWFDALGTKAIYDYFGGVVFEFCLEKAINTINPMTGETYLTPYQYKPCFVDMTNEEIEEYREISNKISQNINRLKENEEMNEYLKRLYIKRASIRKNAEHKYDVLKEIFKKSSEGLKWTLIYCSPQQIDEVMDIVKNNGIIAHRFTEKEGTKAEDKYEGLSERDYLLREFTETKYQVLIAMKCLDEGIDIPPARNSILMSSSGNPREYIQRIGRIIRRFPGKREAVVYDIVVIPSMKKLPSELRDIEWKVFQKELRRYEEIGKVAINNAEVLKMIYDLTGKIKGEN